MKRNYCACLVAVLLSSSGIGLGATRPYVIRLKLAGARLNIDQKDFIRFDPRQKYYLIHSGDNWETPGARLVLCPAEAMSKNGFDSQQLKTVKVVSLPRLRSGWGVNIGDSPQNVQSKLGKSLIQSSGDKKRRNFSYYDRLYVRFTMPTGARKRKLYEYHANYEFRDEKLWKIEYRISDPEGWPRE